MTRKITKAALAKKIGDMLYEMQVGVVDVWIETVGKGRSKSEYLSVEFADSTMQSADVTKKNAWQTAAMAMLLAGKVREI